MPVLFQKPQANINTPGFDSPDFQINQAINTVEIRVTKNAWPVNAQVTASMEYSTDNRVTWLPGSSVTDDGTRTKDMYFRTEFGTPIATGSWWRAHVAVNQTLNCGVVVTVT